MTAVQFVVNEVFDISTRGGLIAVGSTRNGDFLGIPAYGTTLAASPFTSLVLISRRRGPNVRGRPFWWWTEQTPSSSLSDACGLHRTNELPVPALPTAVDERFGEAPSMMDALVAAYGGRPDGCMRVRPCRRRSILIMIRVRGARVPAGEADRNLGVEGRRYGVEGGEPRGPALSLLQPSDDIGGHPRTFGQLLLRQPAGMSQSGELPTYHPRLRSLDDPRPYRSNAGPARRCALPYQAH
jgi:hypothetical protein